MKVLFLAPQPFFVERGTPIAVDLVLRALSERGDQVDLVAYPLGKDMHYDGVRIYRTARLPFIREISPGFSLKKVLYDFLMLLKVFPLVFKRRYDLVHAVEESVFIALILKTLFKIPYIYDMDSSLSQQMIDRHPRLFKPAAFLLNYFEGLAIRHAKAVVPVCDALSVEVEKHNPEKVLILRDISLLAPATQPVEDDLRLRFNIQGTLMMYVGNLESYQGIDLLLESFALALQKAKTASLVVIGGKDSDIQKYQAMAQRLDIHERVFFLGPKPVDLLSDYLAQADILVSPRVKGSNTPMKIYSYLDSGKPLLATDLPTHTQVLDNKVAMLAGASPEGFSKGVVSLVEDEDLRRKLGLAGKRLIEERHSFRIFRENLNSLYDWLQREIEKQQGLVAPLPAQASKVVEVAQPELRIYYQPIVSLKTGTITGFEALARWHHPEFGLLSPVEFISMAEETGQIGSISRWILYEACRQARQWEQQNPASLPLTICVNLSPNQFMQPDLIEQIDQVLLETGLDNSQLKLEVTENTISHNAESVSKRVFQLKDRGIELHVDYDGPDLSSLSLLNDLPIHTLKIDRSFVGRMDVDEANLEAIEKVMRLARDSGLDVIAVGVETEEQLARLRALECEYGQGFLFSQAVDGETAEGLVSSSPPWTDEARSQEASRPSEIVSHDPSFSSG